MLNQPMKMSYVRIRCNGDSKNSQAIFKHIAQLSLHLQNNFPSDFPSIQADELLSRARQFDGIRIGEKLGFPLSPSLMYITKTAIGRGRLGIQIDVPIPLGLENRDNGDEFRDSIEHTWNRIGQVMKDAGYFREEQSASVSFNVVHFDTENADPDTRSSWRFRRWD